MFGELSKFLHRKVTYFPQVPRMSDNVVHCTNWRGIAALSKAQKLSRTESLWTGGIGTGVDGTWTADVAELLSQCSEQQGMQRLRRVQWVCPRQAVGALAKGCLTGVNNRRTTWGSAAQTTHVVSWIQIFMTQKCRGFKIHVHCPKPSKYICKAPITVEDKRPK